MDEKRGDGNFIHDPVTSWKLSLFDIIFWSVKAEVVIFPPFLWCCSEKQVKDYVKNCLPSLYGL